MEYQDTILGKLPSKSNCYKIITIAGHASLCKQRVLKEYEKAFYMQCKLRDLNMDNMFKIDVDIYHENNRPDLDNGFKVLLDCLQQCKVIKNDRQCMEIHARKLIDKEKPRIEFSISEIIL